jgi:signal transduction histidine kinase/CheY-like chemotaxis protein
MHAHDSQPGSRTGAGPLLSALKGVIDDDDDAITVFDRDLKFVTVNAAWKASMGLGDEVIGHTTEELFGTSRVETERGFAMVMMGETVIKTFRTPHDGRLQKVKVSPWRDETGAIVGVITRHAVIEGENVADSRERRLKVALEIARIFAFEADFTSGVVTCEPPQTDVVMEAPFHAFEDLLHLTPPKERAEMRRRWDDYLATGEVPIIETVRRRADGSLSWYRSVLEVIRGLEGGIMGLAGISQLIDDQKRAEQLLMAEKDAAQAADQAKSEFLANMSHEIRTPLTSVIGFTELLAKLDAMPPEALTYIQRITGAGQALLGVINDILDFSKLEAGQVELDPQPFDPAHCVQGVTHLLAAQAQAKGIALIYEAPAGLPTWLNADSARLRQVLVNLVGNAIKFTHTGGVTVRVAYEAGQLKIAVSDSGEGIAADVRDRLFRRFSQVDGSVSRRHGGTGLGLAICKSLVALMGGTIGCDTELGRGSTFWLSVPAAPTAAVLPQETSAKAAGEDAPPAHILIVDDVRANRELVRAMLTPMGHSFEEADNGADAVTLALRSPFDLILMDLQMPGMDGLAAARAIRASSDLNRDTPILAFSANVLSQHTAEALAAGMNDHIAKPIRAMELVSKVMAWAGRSGAQEGDASCSLTKQNNRA